jgi:hypothetical protein
MITPDHPPVSFKRVGIIFGLSLAFCVVLYLIFVMRILG